jgi:hypothetical protein
MRVMTLRHVVIEIRERGAPEIEGRVSPFSRMPTTTFVVSFFRMGET